MGVFSTAAITDEFSFDLDAALDAMASVGMTGVELRLIGDRNVIDFSDQELADVRRKVERRGMRVLSIASPVLKCVLPDAPPLDERFQQDVFGSAYTIADQPRLSARALEIAEQTGAGIIRVFSYWRTTAPERCLDRIVSSLRDLADRAAARGLTIGLENEHACNVGTGAEAGRVLAALDHPALKSIWDPANAFILGETPFPDGYSKLPGLADRSRARQRLRRERPQADVGGARAKWVLTGEVSWPRCIATAIAARSVSKPIGAVTTGIASRPVPICGRNLRDLVEEVSRQPA